MTIVSAPVTAMLERVLARDPGSVNTDWDGALVVTALMDWEDATGDRRCGDFAVRWFEAHRRTAATITDEDFYRSYQGPRARVARGAPLLFSGYSGSWGIGFTCLGLDRRLDDSGPRDLAAALAAYLTRDAERNALGSLLHDDAHDFVIPDTCYLVAPALGVAARLTGREDYLEEAVRQLLLPARQLQDDATGLALTMWTPRGTPRVFWTRATGWLAGAFANTLPFVPAGHPDRPELLDRFRRLAAGIRRVQRDDGGFHVLLDDPTTPTDPTGPALISPALRRGAAEGWLELDATALADAAWAATEAFLTPDGHVRGAYTGWALPAVQGDVGPAQFDNPPDREFVLGLTLLAGAAAATP
jgi:rhamnogalacturonyl hydrolase YesR